MNVPNPNSYVDLSAVVNVIGNIFNDSSLLDEKDEFTILEDDFVQEFHKILFGTMYNLHSSCMRVNMDSIIDYLANRPKYNAVFQQNDGVTYLQEAASIANRDTFNYYYNRLRKFTLLRAYAKHGIDVSDLYDPENVLDIKKKQKQEDWLDSASLTDITERIDKITEDIKYKYIEDDLTAGYQAGDGALELIAQLEQCPEVGIPLYGKLINTITRGARMRKFYLRSGASGTGKTRAMIADACNFACDKVYDPQFGWIKNGTKEPTLFIATEQDKGEIQTMMLAFLSDVNEEHILNGVYIDDEKERVIEAARVLKDSALWIEELPDFSLQDIENKIKKNIREHDVRYVVFDYIHSSLKILSELTHQVGGVKLREDNILFILSAKLKDLANQYGIFLLSGTQLSGDFRNNDTPDQTLLRGAKALADKVDLGAIILDVTPEDAQSLEPILGANPQFQTPNLKISVYKNRRGAFKGCYLWCIANLGTCRINPQFITTWQYKFLSVEDARIIVEDEDSAWSKKGDK